MSLPLPGLTEIIEQFRQAMREHGIEYAGEIEADSTIHRFNVEGDRSGRKNGWYTLHYDKYPAGSFGCHKRYPDQQFNWTMSKDAKTLSPEEDRQIREHLEAKKRERDLKEKERNEKARTKAANIWESSVPCSEHEYLARKGVQSFGLKSGPWEVWDADAGRHVRITSNALLIPMYDRHRHIHSIQAIVPNEDMPEEYDSAKMFLPGGAKKGNFYPIGEPQLVNGNPVFIFCEGYATGASIHEATGHRVFVCFDAGNLALVIADVAQSLLRKGSQATLVVACDNDRWTLTPVNNPGVVHGRAAALKHNGLHVIPQFMDLTSKPTDFNDLHRLEGLGAVKEAFDAILYPAEQTQALEAEPEETGEYKPFSFLGYTNDHFVFYQHEQRQLKFIGQNGFNENTLLNLASLQWWEEMFPKEKGGIDRSAAVNWLNRESNRVGFFDAKRVRGRGAWFDDGRLVVHHGSRLTVDGVAMDLTRIKSNYFYPMGRTMPQLHDNPLTAAEGKRLLDVSRKISWSRPASAPMLVGWAFLAPLCGALKWRPHLWLTGGAGSGKSTILSEFLHPMIRGFCEFAQGSSTEAGVRQELVCDALSILLDEAESNDKREKQRIEGLLALARQASSDSQARTLKGTAGGQSLQYHIRSMFCFSSINTLLSKQADADRLTRLEILPPSQRLVDNWPELSEDLHHIASQDDLSARLVTRALNMAKVLQETVVVFKRVGAKFFKSQRTADQYGTLMAGAWCLTRDTVPVDDEAHDMLQAYEWDEHVPAGEKDDAQRAFEILMASFINSNMGTFTMYQMVTMVLGKFEGESGFSHAAKAKVALKSHGVMVDPRLMQVCFWPDHPNLLRLVEETAFANDLRGQLKRLPGNSNYGNKTVRFEGKAAKVISVPLTDIVEIDD